MNEENRELKTMQGKRVSKTWSIYVDGSSNLKGSRLGFVLTFPYKDVVERAIPCGFKETNNEVEYEALIARLKLVIEIK